MNLKPVKFISLALVALLLTLSGCFSDTTLRWEESVVLPGGGVVVLKRVQHFDEGGYVGAHSFEFQHPITKQSVKWQSDVALHAPALPQAATQQKSPSDGFFRLVALFMVQDAPHILIKPTFANHNEWAGCPYPSMFIFKYTGKNWEQIPYAASPVRMIESNTTTDPKRDRDYIKANNYRLAAGSIKVRRDTVLPHAHGLYLDRFPTQVFQCPQQKRFDFQ